MSIAVLIPWRTTDCPHRTRALQWVVARHAANAWPVVIGRHDEGPWNKALAVDDALSQTTAETLLIADADVWCDGLPKAVRAVEDGAAWAVPHGSVHRLSERATAQALAGEHLSYLSSAIDLLERAYLGIEGGGIVVLRRDTYDACPLDARFEGWGGEDESLGLALRCLRGPAWRGREPLMHLFHPPQPRVTRSTGSEESRALRRRYALARRDPEAMKSLIEEGRCSQACSTAA